MGIGANGWPEGERALDFIVIGVQKGGTTSLWEYLRGYPRIAMPPYKEAPVFCASEEALPDRLAELMSATFAGVPADSLCGKVSTHYMMGLGPVGVDRVAGRIAAALPDVKLIALLRDPVERAISQYRMSVRRGIEARTLDAVVEALLRPDGLAAGRERPTETNSYLVQGEYGRILGCYRRRFPAEQLHVEATEELGSRPEQVVDRILAFLGLPAGHRPPGLGRRHHRGGMRTRLDAEEQASLCRLMEREVWAPLGPDAAVPRRAFEFFLETWNVIPDDDRPELAAPARERLRDHYRRDAGLLAELGVGAPWLAAWDAAPAPA